MIQQDAINKIEKKVDRLVGSLKEEIDKFLDMEIYYPDWEEVQKKENLYKGYREVTRRNAELNRRLTEIGSAILSIKDLKSSLEVSDSMTPRILKKIRGKLNGHLSKLNSYQKMLMNEKDALDQSLRFFHSAQYILGSPRLSGMGD